MAQQIITVTEKASGESVNLGADQIVYMFDKGGDNTIVYAQNEIKKELAINEVLPASAANMFDITSGGTGYQSDTVTVDTATNDEVYSFDIDGNTFSFTASPATSKSEITAGLKAAFDLAPIAGITVVDDAVDTLTITSSIEGEIYVLNNLVGADLSPAIVSAVNAGSVLYLNADRVSAVVDDTVNGDYVMYDVAGPALKKIESDLSAEAILAKIAAL